MLKTLICGSGSFERPRRIKSSLCRRHSGKNNNPYSGRGLDIFSALVADLEEKRQRIYSQIGTEEEDAPLVRFVYSSSNNCVPVVVKLKDRKSSSHVETESPALEQVNNRSSISWKAQYYFPAAVIFIFILLLLAVFGRSAAVLCTSLGWYIIPTLQGIGKSTRKKESRITTRASEKKKMVRSAGPSPPRNSHLVNCKSFS